MNIFVCFFAVMLSAVFTGATERVAYAVGAVDLPSDRRAHASPTARLGGVGFLFAFLLTAYLFVRGESDTVYAIFLSLPILLSAGVLDDIFALKPLWKLLLQASAAAVALSALGVGSPLAFFLRFAYILLLTNAFNLIDGLDTLAGGVGVISLLSLGGILFLGDFHTAGVLSCLLALSVLGFLPHNRHPARLFMGDTGAQSLGFSYALLSLPAVSGGDAAAALLPVLFPIGELSFSFFRRILKGRSPFSADREHLHHKLLSRGYSHERAAGLLHLLTLTLSLAGLLLAYF